jgi:hypothetical protein
MASTEFTPQENLFFELLLPFQSKDQSLGQKNPNDVKSVPGNRLGLNYFEKYFTPFLTCPIAAFKGAINFFKDAISTMFSMRGHRFFQISSACARFFRTHSHLLRCPFNNPTIFKKNQNSKTMQQYNLIKFIAICFFNTNKRIFSYDFQPPHIQ